jgi:hypothetical protein
MTRPGTTQQRVRFENVPHLRLAPVAAMGKFRAAAAGDLGLGRKH